MSGGVDNGESSMDPKTILAEAAKRLIPASGYLISNVAGFLASALVFSTWMLIRLRGSRSKVSIESDEEERVRLIEEIERVRKHIQLLEERKARFGDDLGTIDEAINNYKKILDSLLLELRIREIRLLALAKLRALGLKDVERLAMRMVRKMEQGGPFEEEQYKVLKELEERVKRRELELETLHRILSL